jgi:small subunit ribosomal protein S2
MKDITLEELLEAGCHFGHQVQRANPKARDFVYETREGIQIIDLAKTKEGLDEAVAHIKALASKGSTLLVVGTKRQAQVIVREEVERARLELKEKNPPADGQKDTIYYVTTRWVGGILTNFSEISKNLKKLAELERKLKSEEEKRDYTKREIGLWDKERGKLESFYSGIKTIDRVPDALFIIDTHFEDLAVREAKNMRIPVVGVVDTNADPEVIDYPIPSNDDAVGAIKLIMSRVVDAWIEGSKSEKLKVKSEKSEEKAEEKKPKTKASEEKVKKTATKKTVKKETKSAKTTKKKS